VTAWLIICFVIIKQIKQFVHEVSDDGRVASTTCLYVTAKTKIEPKYNTEETVKWQLPGERSFSAQWLGRWETGRIFPSSSAGLQETACIVVPLANQSFFSFNKTFYFSPALKKHRYQAVGSATFISPAFSRLASNTRRWVIPCCIRQQSILWYFVW
jgi:hypothetical protein